MATANPADLAVKRLMDNLSTLYGCCALLNALDGGRIVDDLLDLTARQAEQIAADARYVLQHRKQQDPREGSTA